MKIKRVVANLPAQDLASADAFYGGFLGLEPAMDLGWIKIFAGAAEGQVSVAKEGGSGTPVPDLSIEVDDLDEALARAAARNITLEYGPAVEPWGVRRFYVRDPFGRLINILSHQS